MAHYHDREGLFEGAVVLFRRGDAVSTGDKRFWQAQLKIACQLHLRQSA